MVRKARRRVKIAGQQLLGRLEALRSGHALHRVERAVLFVGYPRSGHTLVGAALDAHPDVRVAHELDLLRYVRVGASRQALLGLLLRRHRWFARRDRQWTGYDYQIAGQDQDRPPLVIGDKAGGMSTRWLLEEPDLLNRAESQLELPLRVVHHVRNPWDNLATAIRRHRLTIDDALDHFERRVEALPGVFASRPEGTVLTTHHDDLLADPAAVLRTLAAHLRVSPDPDWIAAVSKVVFPNPSRTRDAIPWTKAHRDRLEALLERAEWTRRYLGTGE